MNYAWFESYIYVHTMGINRELNHQHNISLGLDLEEEMAEKREQKLRKIETRILKYKKKHLNRKFYIGTTQNGNACIYVYQSEFVPM